MANGENQRRISFMNQNNLQLALLYAIYIQVHEINASITIAICGMCVCSVLCALVSIYCNALQFASIALYSVRSYYIGAKAHFKRIYNKQLYKAIEK